MKIINLIKRDFLISTCVMKRNFFTSSLLFITLIIIVYYLLIHEASQRDLTANSITLADLIYEFFYGISKNELQLNHFRIPISWLVVQLSYCFILGNYIRSDIYYQSPFLLSHGVTRKDILISKLISTLIISTIITVTLACLFSLLLVFTNTVTGWGTYTNIVNPGLSKQSVDLFIFKSFIIQLFTGILICWLYLLFLLMFESSISYLFVISIIVLTLFLPFNLNPINFSLLVRNNYGTEHEINFLYLVLLFFLFYLTIILFSLILIRKIEFKNGGIESNELY